MPEKVAEYSKRPMGAGVLPIAFHKGQVYFLFSREYIGSDDDGGTYSDFGGSTEGGESYKQTAIREAYEESDGVLGTPAKIKSLIKNDLVDIITLNRYRTYVVEMKYNAKLPAKFRKRFLDVKKKNPEKIARDGLYEKDMLNWVNQRDLGAFAKKVRPWYRQFMLTLESTHYS
jgi:hypothetical protein